MILYKFSYLIIVLEKDFWVDLNRLSKLMICVLLFFRVEADFRRVSEEES